MAHERHHHDHGPANYNLAFAVGVALNVVYIIVEAAAGIWIGSLALLADAGHNLSDVLGLLLAWGAHWLSHLPPTSRRTYGWRSSSILAALLNALILLVAVGGIAWEAIRRLFDPQPVAGEAIIWVAGIGLLINAATALLFFRGRKGDINIRGAYLHMAADAAISAGVVVAGIGIVTTGWLWIDPVVSLLVALLIFLGTWGLLRESVNLALHAVPPGIDPEEVQQYLQGLPGVIEVHDLHIWPMSTTQTALTVHLIKPDLSDPEEHDQFLGRLCRELHDRFGIEHATIQLERGHEAGRCRQAPPDVV